LWPQKRHDGTDNRNVCMTHKLDKPRNRKPGFWSISAIVLLLMLVIIPAGLLISFSSSQALVVETTQVGVDSAVDAKRIAQKLYHGLKRPVGRSSSISLSEKELNGVVALAARSIDGLEGRVKISSSGGKADFTLRVASNPFGRYINVTANVAPSSEGLVVNNLAIGSLDIPSEMLISIVEIILNRALQDEQLGSELLSSIESVAVNGPKLIVVYHAVPDFRIKFAKLKEQVKYNRNDSELVRHYYQDLCRFHKASGRGNLVSLGAYLRHSFTEAKTRSAKSDEPTEENKAALLALAIFLGSEKFDTLIGALDKSSLRACQPAASYIVLANRNDLRLHFVFSAALKIISSSGISFSIGEFKELLDSQRGNSGFSFADLAADRAGIRFAELAVDGSGAEHLQNMAAELSSETVLFPSISGLPEGIHQREFEQRGGIESEYYKKYLAIIEQRIDRLALYQVP